MKAQRYSKQRELVLKTVKANLIHPTALEIYGMTRAVDPTISKSGFKCEELNITVRGTCKNCLTKALNNDMEE